MLNINRINIVKGILSARDGTLVPKFDNGGTFADLWKIFKWQNKRTDDYDSLDLMDAALQSSFNKWLEFDYSNAKTLYEKELQPIVNPGAYRAELEAKNNVGIQSASLVAATQALAERDAAASASLSSTAVSAATSSSATGTKEVVTKAPEVDTAALNRPEFAEDPKLIGESAGTEGSNGTFNGNAAGDHLIQVPEADETDRTGSTKSKPSAEQIKESLKRLTGIAEGVTAGIDLASSTFVDKSEFADDDPTLGKGRQMYDSIANSLMAYGPVGTIVGGAMKAVGLANDMLGSRANTFAVNQETMEEVGGSYGGTTSEIQQAALKSGKKYGLFSGSARRKANRLMEEARRKLNIMTSIAGEAADRRASSQDRIIEQQSLSYERNLTGGYDLRYLHAAKSGAKILYFKKPFEVALTDINDFKIDLTDVPTIFKKGGTILDKISTKYTLKFDVILSEPIDLELFKLGGNIAERTIEVIETDTTQKSVIPEGALHKNKHHLNEVGIDDSELTKKGIPVVDNEGDQQAEIELNEIIFTLEVTKELESRYKEFYESDTSNSRKDVLAIEAGKLLWKEILYNTDDRTGLIDTLKLGGTLLAKEGNKVDDAFLKFLETLPDNQRNYSEDTYRMRRYWELNGKPKDFKEALEKEMFTLEDDGFYHARSVAYNPELDEYEFMKMPGHKTTWMEEEGWYNGMDFAPKEGLTEELADGIKANYILTPKKGKDAEESRRFRERYVFDKSGPFWKYIPRKLIKKNNQGGNISQNDIDLMVKQALLNLLK